MSVADYLDFWRQASDTDALDDTTPVEPRSREDPVRSVLHPVDAMSISIKDDGVDVDLEPGAICKNEVGFRTARPPLKAPALQDLLQPREVCDAQDDVDILVRSCLGAENRIDGPTAVEPDLDPGRLEYLKEIS